MTKLFHRWTKKHRAAHEAKKEIVAAALAMLDADDSYSPRKANKAYARIIRAAYKLKKARTP
jgi:hypothetical protein